MEDGTIDRRKLGPIVFSSKAKMDALNAIVWPVIAKLFQEEVDRLVKTQGVKVIVLEAAVLIEAGWENLVDEVWVVTCSPNA